MQGSNQASNHAENTQMIVQIENSQVIPSLFSQIKFC